MNEILTGKVDTFFIEKNYGFLKDLKSGDSYFFFFDKNEQIRLSKKGNYPIAHIRKGDIVNYSLKKSEQRPKELQAYNLIFIENENVNQIITLIEKGETRFGTVERINEKLYLTDSKIGITFPIKILFKEKDNFDINKILKLSKVEYFLEQRKNPTKIFAKLKANV